MPSPHFSPASKGALRQALRRTCELA
jgi:hypothetical protein